MFSSIEYEVQIPEIIVDIQNKKKYRRCSFLGKGGFAKCYEIVETKSKESFAGKIISKTHIIKNKQNDKITQEIHIHKMLKNKNIVSFHSFFEDDYFVYIVLELCQRRSMMELHKRRRTITEPETRYFIYQILEGTLYLHQQSIIHRDLKLGNIFLSDGMEVKIGDFGLATRIEYKGQKENTICGTPNYIAPEILNETGHSFEVDVWSIGCIMFTLLVGKPPFESSTLKETYARIIRCDYNIPSHLNKNARTLINRILQSDPKKRPCVSELMKADFFTNGYMPCILPTLCLTSVPQFDSINYRESFNRMPLIECNSLKPTDTDSSLKPQNLVLKHTMINFSNTKFKMSPVKNEVSLKINKTNMISLGKELKTILMCKPWAKGIQHLEEFTDPAARPFIWVSKWLDYSDKYGFGYELSDDCISVIFNDFTQIILLANFKDVHYIEKNGFEEYHTIDNTPSKLNKKIKLLKYFRLYMNNYLKKSVVDNMLAKDVGQLSRPPNVYWWHRYNESVTMQLTNGTLQINFADHSKVILCPLMNALTFIKNDAFRTYRFSTIIQYGCDPEFTKYLEYALSEIKFILGNGYL